MRRREDLPLITGSGAYLADLRLDGMLHAGFIRSDEPHALVEEVRIPPKVAAFTAADLGLDRPMPDLHPHPLLDHAHRPAPLAGREVCYVGEPIAVVLADRPETATDLRDRVEVEYTPLPSVGDPRLALEEDSPPVHLGDTSNRVARLSVTFGDAETALRRADEVVEVRLRQHRGAAVPMETRGVLAVWDESRETLTVWTSTQSPFGVRRVIAEYLSLDPDRVRVVAPDVGGGFGPKAAVYPEEVVVAALAIRLGRPVRWLEGRRENLTCMLQQRDQFWTLRGAFDRNGGILGIEGHVVHDNGAYVPYGLLLPATSLRLISGPYRIESVDVALDSVYTNRVPTSPVRGAGRPHAVFALERLLDTAARALGMDRAEIRRRNLVRPGDMPYQVPIPLPGERPSPTTRATTRPPWKRPWKPAVGTVSRRGDARPPPGDANGVWVWPCTWRTPAWPRRTPPSRDCCPTARCSCWSEPRARVRVMPPPSLRWRRTTWDALPNRSRWKPATPAWCLPGAPPWPAGPRSRWPTRRPVRHEAWPSC
ncbi:MAG: hypothetical protein KatS3mg011_0638 [Acidimicrobiia bacterium]|nr:MAG: hypothetical protein KatS3mg011_0638 [Acidimicrobiia bacterium]